MACVHQALEMYYYSMSKTNSKSKNKNYFGSLFCDDNSNDNDNGNHDNDNDSANDNNTSLFSSLLVLSALLSSSYSPIPTTSSHQKLLRPLQHCNVYVDDLFCLV